MKVFFNILILFIVIAIGFLTRKLNIVDKDFRKGLSKFVVYITMPFYIIKNMNQSFNSDILKNSMQLIIISFLSYILMIIIAMISKRIFKDDKEKMPIYQLSMVFANTGFLGFPVLETVMGSGYIFYGAIFNIFFDAFLWTYGVFLFRRDGEGNFDFRKILTPSLFAVIIGFGMFLLSIELPIVLLKSISNIGSLTPSLAMIIIGLMLSEINLKSFFTSITPIFVSIYRLVIVPLIIYLILFLFGFRNELLLVPTILLAMPVAANTAILTDANGGDYKSMTMMVMLSTIMSMITIPILIQIII